MNGIQSMTISRFILETTETIDLWKLDKNNFEDWERGKLPLASITKEFQV